MTMKDKEEHADEEEDDVAGDDGDDDGTAIDVYVSMCTRDADGDDPLSSCHGHAVICTVTQSRNSASRFRVQWM